VPSNLRHRKPIAESEQANVLSHLLKENFDEDPARGGGLSFGEAHVGKHRPLQCLGAQQVREKFGHVAQFVGLQAVDHSILASKEIIEEEAKITINLT
jgi:hypothetical protein